MGLAAVFLLVLLAAALLGLANRGSDVQRPGGEMTGVGPTQGSASGDPRNRSPKLGVTPGGAGDSGNSSVVSPSRSSATRTAPAR
jgi:hypothetical protein